MIPPQENTSQVNKPIDLKYNFVSSPLNYIGGKFKLLPQILPLFPREINNFVDLFCGGLNVAANVHAKNIYANDLNDRMIGVLKLIKETPIDDLLSNIYLIISTYKLSNQNKNGFLKLREDYNNEPSPILLYVLVCYSFNYQFRFNNSLKYNNPFGKERSQFSVTLKKKLIKFNERIANKSIALTSLCFQDFIKSLDLNEGDMVYCDPPYLITTGSYNDGNRGFKDWTEHEEEALYNTLDTLSNKGIKFALSNVLEHKGIRNDALIEWAERYNIIYLNYNYKNSSYNTNRSGSVEVLITNYTL